VAGDFHAAVLAALGDFYDTAPDLVAPVVHELVQLTRNGLVAALRMSHGSLLVRSYELFLTAKDLDGNQCGPEYLLQYFLAVEVGCQRTARAVILARELV